jgi:hypothetical protein
VEAAPAVVEAARKHHIDTLLIRTDGPELGRGTWAGAQSDQMAVRPTDAQTLRESDPVSARADDAPLRSVAGGVVGRHARQGAYLAVVDTSSVRPGLRQKVGGGRHAAARRRVSALRSSSVALPFRMASATSGVEQLKYRGSR